MTNLVNSFIKFITDPVASQFIDQTTENADFIIQVALLGHGIRAGLKINSGSVAIGKFFEFVKFTLTKFGSPSGNYQITLRDSSDTVKFTKNFSVTGLPSSKGVVEHDLAELVGAIAEGDRILYEYGASSGTKFYYDGNAGVSGFSLTIFNYSSVYVDTSDECAYAIIDSQA